MHNNPIKRLEEILQMKYVDMFPDGDMQFATHYHTDTDRMKRKFIYKSLRLYTGFGKCRTQDINFTKTTITYWTAAMGSADSEIEYDKELPEEAMVEVNKIFTNSRETLWNWRQEYENPSSEGKWE